MLDMGVSENRGPYYRALNSRILITRTPKYGTPICGNSHMLFGHNPFGLLLEGAWDLVTEVIIKVTILIITYNPK